MSWLMIAEIASNEELLKRIEKYVVVDGSANLERKERQLEEKFHYYYYIEYGECYDFVIEYQLPFMNVVEKQSVKAKAWDWLQDAERKRASHAHQYFGETSNQNDKRLKGEKPSLLFVDSLQTAVLTVNTFNVEINQFKHQIDGFF